MCRDGDGEYDGDHPLPECGCDECGDGRSDHENGANTVQRSKNALASLFLHGFEFYGRARTLHTVPAVPQGNAAPPAMDDPNPTDDIGPLLAQWPVDTVAAAVTTTTKTVAAGGPLGWQTRIASVSKLFVAFACLVALEEGTLTLEEHAGPEGSTVRHLLSHASGLAFDKERSLFRPGQRRIYSNIGFEKLAEHLAMRAGMGFERYLAEAVVEPLGMSDTALRGSPAEGIVSTVTDLSRFGRELLAPTLISDETIADATRPHFPDLEGVLPGIGSFDPNPWGLGFEIRDGKRPHWTGKTNSEATFGHFGAAGTFLWVDPDAGLAAAALTNRTFDKWAMTTWPGFSDLMLESHRQSAEKR